MKFSTRTKLGAVAGLALIWGAVNAAPSYAVHQTVTGLTTGNQIVQFAVGTPGTLINGTPTSITFPGSATDTDLIGLDYRPRGGNLFAQATGGTVYVLEPNTALAGTVTATPVGTPTAFSGAPTAFGFDFNPQVDRIRVTNNEASGTSDNNYRYNPNNGARVLIDGDLDYSTGDPNDAAVPSIVGSAYTNNIDGTTSTTLFDIDSDLNILAVQTNPNGGALSTVGALGADVTDNVGFDIEQGTGVAYAAVQIAGDPESTFHRINLMSGAATPISGTPQVGPDGTAPLEGISLVPVPVLRFTNATTTVAENGGPATVTVVREGPLNQTATVNYATSNGTATAGSDYTATSGTLTFAPGDAQETITIPVTDDADDEPGANETLTVTLSGPSASANLFASPATSQVAIADDEATPGALVALISVPFQTEKKVAKSMQLRYSYSCNRACSESSSLQLKDGTELATNSSSLPDAGKTDQVFTLDKSDVKAIKDAKGKRSVALKIVTTFTDDDAYQEQTTTKFKLDR
jgi:Domain of unknown function (DUF4394)/Calx-beta domain